MRRARIVGVGMGVPAKVLTNLDLEKMVDTSDQWITERTGIKERHIASETEATSDMAAAAALEACRKAEVKPQDLDAIIVGTVTPDTQFPATAVYVQQKIGASNNCPAFDISAACAGFLFGLGLAEGLMRTGRHKRVLVVGAELLSRVLDWTDRNTCVLFGDGSGAAVLVPSEDDRGILDIELRTDGSQAVHLDLPAGGSRLPASHKTIEEKMHFVRMNGRQVFSNAVRNMSAASATVLERCGYKSSDVTAVFAHQANMRILEGVSQRTGIELERFFINIPKFGNTSSASVPIALCEAIDQGRVKEGDLLLLTALGAGVSWASALMRW